MVASGIQGWNPRSSIDGFNLRTVSFISDRDRKVISSSDDRGFQPWITEATICLVCRRRFQPSVEVATNCARSEIGLEPVTVWFQHQMFTTRPLLVTTTGTHHVLIVFETWCSTIATSFVHEGTGSSVGGWWGIRMCDRQTGGVAASWVEGMVLVMARGAIVMPSMM